MPHVVIEELRDQLRRDPSDGDVAFLLSLAVREPFVVYAAERQRLRGLTCLAGRSARELLVAESAEHLLALTGNTPRRAIRRPESGTRAIIQRDRVRTDDESSAADVEDPESVTSKARRRPAG